MIYALVHPDTLEVRYIGKSRDAASRIKQHRANARKGADSAVYRWWRKVVERDGCEPSLVRLGDGDSAEEIAMIARLRADGARLLNMTDGGDGCAGTPEVRRRIAESLRGKKLTPEHRDRVVKNLQHGVRGRVYRKPGWKMSEEQKAKISASKTGAKLSAEHKARLSERMRGNKRLLGHVHSPETRALIGEKSRAARARKFWSSGPKKKSVVTP